MSKKITALILSLLMIISLLCGCIKGNIYEAQSFKTDENTKLVVHFIDVGQGNSVLLESDNSFVLIDAGEKEYSDTVCEHIKSRGADSLDYVIATHPHSDHIGGLSKVIDEFQCKNFITPETDQQTNTWLDVLNAVEENNVNFIDPIVSDTYSFGEAEFEILAPNSDYYEDYNNYSVVVKVSCEDTSFLLTGDAEALSENEMLNNGCDLSADVLMLGHHGSTTSSTKEFLTAVNPAYAVISCGKDNDYGHPHKQTLDKLNNMGIEYFRTDESGDITAVSDGSSIVFYYENSDTQEEYISKASKPDEIKYIGNKKSKKFHLPDCGGVKDMNEKNRVVFESKEQATDEGYSPCKTCNP